MPRAYVRIGDLEVFNNSVLQLSYAAEELGTRSGDTHETVIEEIATEKRKIARCVTNCIDANKHIDGVIYIKGVEISSISLKMNTALANEPEEFHYVEHNEFDSEGNEITVRVKEETPSHIQWRESLAKMKSDMDAAWNELRIAEDAKKVLEEKWAHLNSVLEQIENLEEQLTVAFQNISDNTSNLQQYCNSASNSVSRAIDILNSYIKRRINIGIITSTYSAATFSSYQAQFGQVFSDKFKRTENLLKGYCGTELKDVISKKKADLKLDDFVEFQSNDTFCRNYPGINNPNYVNGYNTGGKSFVKLNGPHPLKTALHEHTHQLSSNDIVEDGMVKRYQRGVSINGRDTQVNEALTELFTKKMMKEDYPKKPDVSYIENMKLFEKMESGFGENLLKEAYFQNKPELLKARYEEVMSGESWEDFSRALEDTRRADPRSRRQARAQAEYLAAKFTIRSRKM